MKPCARPTVQTGPRWMDGSATAQGPVPGAVELGQLTVDVHGDRPEVVDVVAVCRGNVGQDVVGHMPAGGAHRRHGQAVVVGGPGDHGVGDQGQAPGLRGLGLQVPAADGALVGVEQATAQGVQALALVQLPGDAPPVGFVRQVAGG